MQKLTQEELAEGCDVHPNYIGLVERGERNVPLVTLLVIAKALAVRPDTLIAGLEPLDRKAARRELSRVRRKR